MDRIHTCFYYFYLRGWVSSTALHKTWVLTGFKAEASAAGVTEGYIMIQYTNVKKNKSNHYTTQKEPIFGFAASSFSFFN